MEWLFEIVKGIGRFFLNPLVYWSILLVIFAGYKRIKQERLHFGVKVYDIFSEWKNTGFVSVGYGLFLTAIVIGVGMVLSYETILVLSIVTILLSLSLRFSLLSPSYTIGITYFILLFIPHVLKKEELIPAQFFMNTNFTVITILLGLFLIIEANLLKRTKQDHTYPALTLGTRGKWIGEHYVRKLAVIPFFMIVPSGLITSFAPYWPALPLGADPSPSYSLILVPFLVGFNHVVRGTMPELAIISISKKITLMACIVILLAIGSIFISWLSFLAVLVAIFGREYINYKHRMKDKAKYAYFYQSDNGLQVLGIIPGSPADRLGIEIGEIITKVNGHKVMTVKQFYEALQASGAFFKLDVLDGMNEIRFIQSAFYEGEHHELGLLFIDTPHYKRI